MTRNLIDVRIERVGAHRLIDQAPRFGLLCIQTAAGEQATP